MGKRHLTKVWPRENKGFSEKKELISCVYWLKHAIVKYRNAIYKEYKVAIVPGM